MTTSRPEQSPGGQAGPAPMTAEGACAEGSGMSLAQDARPQPRSRPSRRALLTAGGVTVGGAMALSMTRQAPAEAQTYYVVQGAQVVSVNDEAYDGGATGNGETDDTSAIQAALNATPAGGICFFPAPSNFYLISKTLTVPDRPISVLGPAVAAPAKQRSTSVSNYTPAIIKPGNGTNLNAIISDTSWTSTSANPSPAGGTLIRGIVVDGNAANQDSTTVGSGSSGGSIANIETWSSPSPGTLDTGTIPSGAPTSGYAAVQVGSGPPATIAYTGISGNSLTGCTPAGGGSGTVETNGTITFGLGHGIALMGSANSIVDCGVQNAAGAGIVLADQSFAGHNVSSALIENGIYGCRAFQSGTYGIWVQHNVGISDGYLYDSIVDQNCVNFTGTSASYEGIHMDSCGDWKVCHNHVYATLGSAYYLGGASGYYIEGNRTDNFGYQGGSTTYYGYSVVPGLPGGVFANNQTNQTLPPASAGNWTHFFVQGGAEAMPVYFANNLVQQTVSSGTDGTSTGYEFTGGSGGLIVKGADGPFVVPSGFGLTSAPTVSGSVSFVDFRPLVVTNSYAPETLTSLPATSTSFTAISSANVNTGAFTVGPQGTAIITVSLVAEWSNAAGAAFNVAVHGTTTPAANAVIFKDSASTTPRAYQMQFAVTGLTPFTSYTFDLIACMTSGDTLTVLAFGTTSSSPTLTSQGAPVTMTVQAL
jgi:hypothetical protein